MVTFEDDDDHTLSQDGSSDAEETMDDVDGAGDKEEDANDMGEDNEGNDEDDDEEDRDMPESPTARRSSLANGTHSGNRNDSSQMDVDGQSQSAVTRTSASPRPQSMAPFLPQLRPGALEAPSYDVVPTIAAPHATSINTVTATPDMRWVFSGGSDGYIRKFNWVETANSKSMLTVAQRHPFVDSVTKAGVLISYWENLEESANTSADASQEDSATLSPVYSLAVQHQALWLLSGLDSGGINLQTVRHQEGTRIHCLKKHKSAVSALTLGGDEHSVLSGSWDKTICDWDLNTGQVKRSFEGSGGQISAIELRPFSSVPVPVEPDTPIVANGTLASNNAAPTLTNGVLPNGIGGGMDGAAESPGNDSLFGGGDDDNNSLFGEGPADNTEAPSGANFGDDDDDEFARAIASGLQQQDDMDTTGDADALQGVGGPVQPVKNEAQQNTNGQAADLTLDGPITNGDSVAHSQPFPDRAGSMANGYSFDDDDKRPEDTKPEPESEPALDAAYDQIPESESTFLDASIDGTLRVWDKRQQRPVGRMNPARGAPPWCMGACWSVDGNHVYAGRRNGTVEEYSLHKSLREPQRILKFPAESGAVTAVRPMPNGRHLMCASRDNLRLYDLRAQESSQRSAVPFLIVPGHRTGIVSQVYIDRTCTFMISTSGNRGWEGSHTEVLLGYEIAISR